METLSYIYFKEIIRTNELHNDDHNLNEVPILPKDDTGYSNAFIYPDVTMNSYATNDDTEYSSYIDVINKITYDIETLESIESGVTTYLNDTKINDIMSKHLKKSNKYYNVYTEFHKYNDNTKYTIGDINKTKRLMRDEDHFKQ